MIQPYYRKRSTEAIRWVQDQLSDYPCRIHTPEGAIFLWLWFKNLPITTLELYQRLKQRGVFIVPGEYFFPGFSENWIHRHECLRLNYAEDGSIVKRGIEIIAEEIKQAYEQE